MLSHLLLQTTKSITLQHQNLKPHDPAFTLLPHFSAPCSSSSLNAIQLSTISINSFTYTSFTSYPNFLHRFSSSFINQPCTINSSYFIYIEVEKMDKSRHVLNVLLVMLLLVIYFVGHGYGSRHTQVFKVYPKTKALDSNVLGLLPKGMVPPSGPSKKHNEIGLQSSIGKP